MKVRRPSEADQQIKDATEIWLTKVRFRGLFSFLQHCGEFILSAAILDA